MLVQLLLLFQYCFVVSAVMYRLCSFILLMQLLLVSQAVVPKREL